MFGKDIRHMYDWPLLGAMLGLFSMGLVTMYGFTGESAFFMRQLIWVIVGFIACFITASVDVRFLKKTSILVGLFLFFNVIFILLLAFGVATKGAQSWLSFGGLGIQPADPMKLVLILMFAKYFSRRHVEIAHIRHILVSGLYVLVPFLLVFLQPDFGSAIIFFAIWFGMVVVSGISKKHLFAVLGLGIVSFAILWQFVFLPHQKERIMTFLHPLTDIQGAGYNAFQSTVAVGSGQFLGKGIGYGTQSRLEFLPEYETDFIFAAFAEEWGFVGSLLLFGLFAVVFGRIISIASRGAGNFETLYGLGLVVFLGSHVIVHVGMNIGLLPVTGLPLPFVSYGGSHVLTECVGVGILLAQKKYARAAHKDALSREIVGVGDAPIM
ncbi:MAG: rod shape-determining protein RodA [Candidatus Yonathbacteria bacterium]|nr:rod shape-determining protein RodA [Candidatus Yonathbacteria bacterium]NTW48113.1 rod shape-determining protein RodA [Candidatus Yonathbacteria bacterium]